MKLKKSLSLIRLFVSYAWECRASYFIFFIADIVLNTVSPFITILFPALVIDELTGQRRPEYIVLYVACTAALQYAVSAAKGVIGLTKEKYADLYNRYLQMKLAEKCVAMDFQHTEDKAVLDQLEKAKTGIEWYSGGISGILDTFGAILTHVATLLGTAALVIGGAPVLIPVYAVCITAETVFRHYVEKINREHFLRLSKENRAFGYMFWELANVRFGKDIRLYGAEQTIEDKCKASIRSQAGVWKSKAMHCLPYNLASVPFTAGRYFAELFILGKKALGGAISIGSFTMYMNASNTFGQSLQNIIWCVQKLYSSLAYINEFVVFMEYPDAVRHGSLHPDTGAAHTIEFKDVSFTYPHTNVQVLKKINVVLHSGEHISVVGLNGAGKTTFIKLLCRLYDPTEGQILLDGTDIREYVYEEYVKLISVVFQDFELFAFTARENVTLTESHAKAEDVRKNEEKHESIFKAEECAVADDEKFERVIRQAGLSEAVAKLKYGADTFIMKGFDHGGTEMSGGEQQKLAIARALYKDAPVVILDEPTAALDPIAEYEIYRQFDTLVDGKTAIYISHRLSSCRFCDIIYVFVDGEIKERGTHAELAAVEGGHYAKMFAAQAQYYK